MSPNALAPGGKEVAGEEAQALARAASARSVVTRRVSRVRKVGFMIISREEQRSGASLGSAEGSTNIGVGVHDDHPVDGPGIFGMAVGGSLRTRKSLRSRAVRVQ